MLGRKRLVPLHRPRNTPVHFGHWSNPVHGPLRPQSNLVYFIWCTGHCGLRSIPVNGPLHSNADHCPLQSTWIHGLLWSTLQSGPEFTLVHCQLESTTVHGPLQSTPVLSIKIHYSPWSIPVYSSARSIPQSFLINGPLTAQSSLWSTPVYVTFQSPVQSSTAIQY